VLVRRHGDPDAAFQEHYVAFGTDLYFMPSVPKGAAWKKGKDTARMSPPTSLTDFCDAVRLELERLGEDKDRKAVVAAVQEYPTSDGSFALRVAGWTRKKMTATKKPAAFILKAKTRDELNEWQLLVQQQL
jgi:hypothetical protein